MFIRLTLILSFYKFPIRLNSLKGRYEDGEGKKKERYSVPKKLSSINYLEPIAAPLYVVIVNATPNANQNNVSKPLQQRSTHTYL